MPKKKTDPEMQDNVAPEEVTTALPKQTDTLVSAETDCQEPLLLDEADDEMVAAASGQDPLLIDEVEETEDEAEETACEPMPDPDFQAVSEEPRKDKPARRRRKAAEPPEGTPLPEEGAKKPAGESPPPRRTDPVLTIVAHEEIQTPEELEETAWHEIKNAYLSRRILSGILSGVETLEGGSSVAVVFYKQFRVVIPVSEMLLNLSQTPNHYGDIHSREQKILSGMVGAEIDFIIKGIEDSTRCIVASRKEAMLRKRRLFYFGTDDEGMYRIYEGRLVQARVVAVADKVIRVEAFGVETRIVARAITPDWLGSAHDHYHVGDKILIRIQKIARESLEALSIEADVRSVTDNAPRDDLKKVRVQGKYAGVITDIYHGVVFIRLHIGVNAVAHSCFDPRTPGKKDDVAMVITHLDEERNVAVGIITRILRRNL